MSTCCKFAGLPHCVRAGMPPSSTPGRTICLAWSSRWTPPRQPSLESARSKTPFGLVVQIESSEINEVFNAALAATDSAFVKKLRPFRKAMEAHMSYIVERLPELSPQLLLACRELRARFPKVRN